MTVYIFQIETERAAGIATFCYKEGEMNRSFPDQDGAYVAEWGTGHDVTGNELS
jgi:hypothetical protein